MSKRTASTAHHRGILAGNPAKGLRGTLVEHRGIFSSVVNIYDDPSITQAEIELNRWTPTEILQDLSEAADKVLQSAGEDGYLKTLMKAKRSTDSDAATNAVRQWHKKIITKRGALSCEGIAADFLFAKDQLGCREDFSSSQWDAVMTFALALHKFMLDHWGHHELIASAMETIQNLSSGSQASGLRLTFESRKGLPTDGMHASLAHANWNFHRSQAC